MVPIKVEVSGSVPLQASPQMGKSGWGHWHRCGGWNEDHLK